LIGCARGGISDLGFTSTALDQAHNPLGEFLIHFSQWRKAISCFPGTLDPQAFDYTDNLLS